MRLSPFLVVAAMVKTVFVFLLFVLALTTVLVAAVFVTAVLVFLIVFHDTSPFLAFTLTRAVVINACPQKANAIQRNLVLLYTRDKPSKPPLLRACVHIRYKSIK